MKKFQEILKIYLETPEGEVVKRGEILLRLNYLQETSEEVKIFWEYLESFPKNPTSVC